jgi:hypothetical protein
MRRRGCGAISVKRKKEAAGHQSADGHLSV